MAARVIEFTVEGAPVGKGRPRFARAGGFVRAYTPAATEQYESLVRDAFRQARGAAPMAEDAAVLLSVRAFFPIPVSRSKKWKAEAILETTPVVTRPDWDNIGKIICDALNGVAWRDDSQICAGGVWKFYSPRPRVDVRIEIQEAGT